MGEDTRQTDTSTDNKGRLELSRARAPTDDTLERTVGKYAHGLLLESPSVPCSTDHWAVRAKIRQKRLSRWL